MRAVYRWRVDPDHADEFARNWTRVTRLIRENVPGARGSMLMRSLEDPTLFLAMARWDSFDRWQAARESAGSRGRSLDPDVAARQSEISEFLSAEPLEIVEDLLEG